jgi:hypothetical protein
MADGGIDGSDDLRTYRHLVQHPRHPFSKLRAEEARAGVDEWPPDGPPDPPKQPSGEEVPREGPRYGSGPHVPATAEQGQQHEHCNATCQPDHHLRVAQNGHLSLQEMVGSLALGHRRLTGPEFIEALINGG